jgi:protein O-mannosyl-transferase
VPRRLLLSLVLVAAVLAAYRPVLDAGFIWNDDTYLTGNRTLDGLEGLRLVWTSPRANEQYYPMVFTSFWVEKRLWGLAPFGYHLVNVLLHAGSALLLWTLLARLGVPGAGWAAALFALHPMCVESVAWVTERKNTLSLFLSLLAMLAYLASREEREEEAGGFLRKGRRQRRGAPGAQIAAPQRRPLLSFMGFFLFVLALLAKTTAVAVPFVLLVLVWWKRGEVRGKDVRPLVPWFAAGIALAAHTAWLERTMVAAKGSEWSLGLAGRLQLAGRAVFFYSKKFLLPLDLAFIYERWTVDPHALLPWLPTLAALGLLALAWRFRERLGRGPLAALLIFFGVLFPAMGFLNVYPMRFSWVADHFAYQAVAVASSALVCGAATRLARTSLSGRRAVAVLAAAALALPGILSFRQARIYEGEETLWTDTLSKNPSCFLCETNYGIWLAERGRDAEAAAHLEASLRLKPDEVPTLLNLAQADERLGRLDASAVSLRSALRVDPSNAAALINLATADARAGRVDDAIASYREALRIGSPGDYLAHNGLGAALMRRGDAAEAIGHFREALRLRPGYEHARANLERALAATAPSGP